MQARTIHAGKTPTSAAAAVRVTQSKEMLTGRLGWRVITQHSWNGTKDEDEADIQGPVDPPEGLVAEMKRHARIVEA